jgi:hypothetical protein
MGLSATSSQSSSREGALAADNGGGRRWRPVGDGQQGPRACLERDVPDRTQIQ